MKDKCTVAYSPLTGLLCADHGFVERVNGRFGLKIGFEQHVYHASKFLGPNATRVIMFGPWFVRDRIHMFTPFYFNRSKMKWDLDKWSPNYWKVFREYVRVWNKYGVRVYISLFDACGIQPNQDLKKNPWCSNLQGVEHFTKSEKYFKKLVRKVLFETKGMDVGFEICNELNLSEAQVSRDRLLYFSNEVLKLLRDAKVDPKYIIYGAVVFPRVGEDYMLLEMQKAGSNAGSVFGTDQGFNKESRHLIFRPCHGALNESEVPFGKYFDFVDTNWLGKPIALWLSDDGSYYPEGSDCRPNGKCRPSGHIWNEFIKYVAQRRHHRHNLAFEMLPRNCDYDSQIGKWNGVALAYHNVYGKKLHNKGRYQNPIDDMFKDVIKYVWRVRKWMRRMIGLGII